MVGVYVLFVVVRLPEICLEMGLERQWTLSVPSERICTQCHVTFNAEVVDLVAKEGVVSLCIPCQILLVLTVRACIELHCGLDHLRSALHIVGRPEAVIVHKLVSDTYVEL